MSPTDLIGHADMTKSSRTKDKTIVQRAPRVWWYFANTSGSDLLGTVAGVLQHAAKIDNLLRVDVLVLRCLEGLGLGSEGDQIPSIRGFLRLANRLE